MPDQPQGGLAAMAPQQPAPNPSQAADLTAANMQAAPVDPFQKSLEEYRKGRSILDQQIQRLQESLTQRTQLPFNPMWMKVASGFLKPSKTGSFGESLGYAAEGAAEEAPKEAERQSAIDKMSLDLQQKRLDLQRGGLEMEDLMRLGGIGGTGGPSVGAPGAAAPAGGAAPAAMPAGAPAAPTQVAQAPQGQTPSFRQMPMISDADVTRAYAISKEHGDKIANIAKMQREDIISTPQGPFSRSQGKYLEAEPFQIQTTEVDIPILGPQKITQRQAREIDKIRQTMGINTPEGRQALVEFYAKEGIGGVQPLPKKPGKPTEVSGLKTPDEKAAEKSRVEAEEKEIGKGAGEAVTGLMTSAQQSEDIRQLAAEAEAIAKSNPNAFKLMQNKDVRSAYDTFLQSVKTGVQTPWGGFSLPGDIVAKHKISNEDLMALQKFAQVEGVFTLLNRRTWLKGQGAISNGESGLASQIGPQAADRPEVIRMKAEAVRLKADFEEKTYAGYDEWKQSNPTGTFGRFLTSDEFKDIRRDYTSRLEKSREANAKFLGHKPGKSDSSPAPSQPAKPAESGGNKQPSLSERLEAARKKKSEGFE